MEEEKKKPLLKRIDELEKKTEILEPAKRADKKWRVPGKAKVSKKQAAKGYATVGVIENGQLRFNKVPIENMTFELDKMDSYHATDGREAVTYNGAPFYMLHKGKINPINLNFEGANETYGMKYIMARLLGDAIKLKKQASGMVWIVVIIIAVAILGKILHWY